MSITVRPYKGGPALEVDARYEHHDGSIERVRRRFKNGTSEAEARRWGEKVLVEISRGTWRKRRERQKKHVMTVAQFVPIYLGDYCPNHDTKPSTVQNKRSHLNRHILPILGPKRLDEVSTGDVEKLIAHMKGITRGSKNNILSTLNKLLEAAVGKKAIDHTPCEVKMIAGRCERYPQFYPYDEYDRLMEGAAEVDLDTLAAVGFGGDEGMRCGEVAAIKWRDLDLTSAAPSVVIRRTAWRKGVDLLPKTNSERKVPLTAMMLETLTKLYERTRRLAAQSAGHKDVVPLEDVRPADPYVFPNATQGRISPATIRRWFKKAQRAAGLPVTGRFHMLRHTFCSHLAARGVPLIDIKALAGHQSIQTTEKYMHNQPGAKERGIATLDGARASRQRRVTRGEKCSAAKAGPSRR